MEGAPAGLVRTVQKLNELWRNLLTRDDVMDGHC